MRAFCRCSGACVQHRRRAKQQLTRQVANFSRVATMPTVEPSRTETVGPLFILDANCLSLPMFSGEPAEDSDISSEGLAAPSTMAESEWFIGCAPTSTAATLAAKVASISSSSPSVSIDGPSDVSSAPSTPRLAAAIVKVSSGRCGVKSSAAGRMSSCAGMSCPAPGPMCMGSDCSKRTKRVSSKWLQAMGTACWTADQATKRSNRRGSQEHRPELAARASPPRSCASAEARAASSYRASASLSCEVSHSISPKRRACSAAISVSAHSAEAADVLRVRAKTAALASSCRRSSSTRASDS
mmetsp:Transcript_103267/g.331133  ORF Transcript_103267/g.331133 Transcript_103267/m.331133 type:complete len:299 (-) Transcript_103267:1596-2492(-)